MSNEVQVVIVASNMVMLVVCGYLAYTFLGTQLVCAPPEGYVLHKVD